MTHKKTLIAILALVLLLCLCSCGKGSYYTSERLSVELVGEGTKTLTVKLIGPSVSLYAKEMKVPQGEAPIFTVGPVTGKDDELQFKVKGAAVGSDDLIFSYLDEATYASVNITIAVDDEMKLTVGNVMLKGDPDYKSISDDLPLGNEISNNDDSSKIVRLVSADSPWILEDFDDACISVDELGCNDDGKTYEFLVRAVAAGYGEVRVINRNSKQRINMCFQVSNVVEGEYERLSLTLTDTAMSTYNEMETAEYADDMEKLMSEVARFAPGAYIPASVMIKDFSAEEGYLDISLEMDGRELMYLISGSMSVKEIEDKLAKGSTELDTDAFESNGVNVDVFYADGRYGIGVWEKDSLSYQLYIPGITDIIKAGDVVEAFLSNESL